MVVILNVAEKPSVARGLVEVLSNMAGRPSSSTPGQSVYNHVFTVPDVRFPDPRNPRGDVPHTMVMTSVTGHIAGIDFGPGYRSWKSPPPSALFSAPVESSVAADKLPLKAELEKQSKKATVLVLWLDCDREGEAIADEVDQICRGPGGNPRLQTFRAKFSAVMAGEVGKALSKLGRIDRGMVDAVNARQEIDLRIGSVFTRFQTNR